MRTYVNNNNTFQEHKIVIMIDEDIDCRVAYIVREEKNMKTLHTVERFERKNLWMK